MTVDWFTDRTCERFPYPADGLGAGGYSEWCATEVNWLAFGLWVFAVLFIVQMLVRIIVRDRRPSPLAAESIL